MYKRLETLTATLQINDLISVNEVPKAVNGHLLQTIFMSLINLIGFCLFSISKEEINQSAQIA